MTEYVQVRLGRLRYFIHACGTQHACGRHTSPFFLNAVSLIFLATVDLHAAVSALVAALVAASVAELTSLSAIILTKCSNSGLGKYLLFSRLSSHLAINSSTSLNLLSTPESFLAGIRS